MTLYVQLSGLLVIAVIVAVRGNGPKHAAALLAVPAAVSGTLGLYAFYRGMAVGAMSVIVFVYSIDGVFYLGAEGLAKDSAADSLATYQGFARLLSVMSTWIPARLYHTSQARKGIRALSGKRH